VEVIWTDVNKTDMRIHNVMKSGKSQPIDQKRAPSHLIPRKEPNKPNVPQDFWGTKTSMPFGNRNIEVQTFGPNMNRSVSIASETKAPTIDDVLSSRRLVATVPGWGMSIEDSKGEPYEWRGPAPGGVVAPKATPVVKRPSPERANLEVLLDQRAKGFVKGGKNKVCDARASDELVALWYQSIMPRRDVDFEFKDVMEIWYHDVLRAVAKRRQVYDDDVPQLRYGKPSKSTPRGTRVVQLKETLEANQKLDRDAASARRKAAEDIEMKKRMEEEHLANLKMLSPLSLPLRGENVTHTVCSVCCEPFREYPEIQTVDRPPDMDGNVVSDVVTRWPFEKFTWDCGCVSCYCCAGSLFNIEYAKKGKHVFGIDCPFCSTESKKEVTMRHPSVWGNANANVINLGQAERSVGKGVYDAVFWLPKPEDGGELIEEVCVYTTEHVNNTTSMNRMVIRFKEFIKYSDLTYGTIAVVSTVAVGALFDLSPSARYLSACVVGVAVALHAGCDRPVLPDLNPINQVEHAVSRTTPLNVYHAHESYMMRLNYTHVTRKPIYPRLARLALQTMGGNKPQEHTARVARGSMLHGDVTMALDVGIVDNTARVVHQTIQLMDIKDKGMLAPVGSTISNVLW